MQVKQMTTELPAPLQGAAASGSSPRPAHVDHVHSALGIQQVLFSLVGADGNVTTDQVLTKAFDFTNYLVTELRYANASVSLTTASGGVYTGAAKAGVEVVANAALSALTGPTIGATPAITAAGKDVLVDAALYLALTTAQGAAATLDVYVIGVPLS